MDTLADAERNPTIGYLAVLNHSLIPETDYSRYMRRLKGRKSAYINFSRADGELLLFTDFLDNPNRRGCLRAALRPLSEGWIDKLDHDKLTGRIILLICRNGDAGVYELFLVDSAAPVMT